MALKNTICGLTKNGTRLKTPENALKHPRTHHQDGATPNISPPFAKMTSKSEKQ
jgi:hypothetical protein